MKIFVLKFSKLTLLTVNTLIVFYLFIESVVAVQKSPIGHYCVIQADNTTICWGLNKEGQALPPAGTFLQVSAGGEHSCGIRTDKTVACWGLNSEGQATPPQGTFLQISAGHWHNCGVKTDHTLACWGSNNPYWSDKDPYRDVKEVKTLGQSEPPSGTFLQVSAGGRHTCGLRTDHTVACWGSHLIEPQRTTLSPGDLSISQSTPPSGEFSQVTSGVTYTCGIRPDQTAEFWGSFGVQPPIDTFYLQMTGRGGRCGLKTDHTVVCFGGQDLPGSEGQRVPNSTCQCPIPGMNSRCACTTDPSYTFSQLLETGAGHACGIRTDNTVVCWGYDPEGQTFPPQGLIVKSADPACLVYGVHNDSKRTQFFIANINAGPLEIYLRSEGLTDNLQIEALDMDRLNNQLFAASGEEGKLYEVRNGAQAVSEVGELGFKKVEALSFHPDRSLWGWAQDTGLFQVERDDHNELQLPGTVIIPYDGAIKIKDISWNTEGTILYGVENLEQGNRLWSYDQSKGEAKLICEDLMASLTKPINALETHPDNSLIFTFEDNKKLDFGVIDVPHCKMTTTGEIATDYHQVKGIAWPDCSKPASVAALPSP